MVRRETVLQGSPTAIPSFFHALHPRSGTARASVSPGRINPKAAEEQTVKKHIRPPLQTYQTTEGEVEMAYIKECKSNGPGPRTHT